MINQPKVGIIMNTPFASILNHYTQNTTVQSTVKSQMVVNICAIWINTNWIEP